jgi:type III restriction enzyme
MVAARPAHDYDRCETLRWETCAERCHINWVILDSDWEGKFCRVAESHLKVRAYVKNDNLGLKGESNKMIAEATGS